MRYRLARVWQETWEKEHGHLSQAETLVIGFLCGRRDWQRRVRLRSVMAKMPFSKEKVEDVVKKLVAKGFVKISLSTPPRVKAGAVADRGLPARPPPPIDVRGRLKFRSKHP